METLYMYAKSMTGFDDSDRFTRSSTPRYTFASVFLYEPGVDYDDPDDDDPLEPHWINWSHIQDGTSQVNHIFRAVVGHPE